MYHLIDNYGRTVSYLRLSVTDRCNLRCVYCRPGEPFRHLENNAILKYEEFHRLTRIAARLGIRKIRITGGEPLVRKGLLPFINRMTKIPGIEDLSLTTNGTFLADCLGKLYASGIRRLNISLDSLRRERFHLITGADRFEDVWNAIQKAHKMDFYPIKINTVVMKGVNDDEIIPLASLSKKYPFHVRFIEYMPIGIFTEPFKTMPVNEIVHRLETIGELIPVSGDINDGPAQRYRFAGAPGEIGFISGMSQHYCHSCNRLRLTADGFLRPCLLSNHQIDVKGPLRQGADDDELAALFVKAVKEKPRQHGLTFQGTSHVEAQMSAIGG